MQMFLWLYKKFEQNEKYRESSSFLQYLSVLLYMPEELVYVQLRQINIEDNYLFNKILFHQLICKL